MELSDLKAKIFALLREDEEFRYAVAGMLGLDEILRRLEKHDERFEEILRRLDKHEAELVKLREDMIAGFKRYDEAIAKLRADMNQGFRRHDEEIAKLRSDMMEGFKRHDEEIAKLREDFNRMLRVIGQIQKEQRKLREGQARLEKRVDSLESAMISGFGEMGKFAGLTFEEFVRKFLSAGLRRSEEIPEGAELVRGFIDGEEINIFLEDPLIVGEATSYAESADEIMKVLRKAEVAKAKYSREPRKILVILTAKSDAAGEMMRVAEEKGVELIIGKIVD